MAIAPPWPACIMPGMSTSSRKYANTLFGKARKRAQLSQMELAAKAKCDQASISRFEMGRGIPRLKLAKKLADILDLDVIDILNPPGKRQRKAA